MIKKCCLVILIPMALFIFCLLLVLITSSYRALSPAPACQQSVENYLQPGISSQVITSDGIKRCYLLYLPVDYDPTQPVPVVISFHGFASTPGGHSATTRWNAIADYHNFIVVYPQGTGFPLRWNSFPSVRWSPADDIAFTRDLIIDLEATLAVDKSRIYITGFSNGGAMTHNIACELSDIIAAVGIISAPVTEPSGGCHPSRPVPVMAFHGTDDLIVNHAGTNLDLAILNPQKSRQINSFSYLPASEWIKRWSQRNQCNPIPEDFPIRGKVNSIRYTGCADQADVIFYTIEGGGHTWPGGGPLSGLLVGKASADINASAELWSFFQQHPLTTTSLD
jgi:polyhydroxybutyrate depolymerase